MDGDLLRGLLNQAVEVTPEVITISDPSLPDNPLIYANEAFYTRTGYGPDEVLGRNCRFLRGPGTDLGEATRLRSAIRNRRPCVVELLNYRKDGSAFWNRLSVVPLTNARGEVTHFAGFQSDITDIREGAQARAQFRAMQATMQSVNDIVRNFLNQMQHFRVELDSSGKTEELAEYDRIVCATLDRLQVLCSVPEYREREIGPGLVVLDTREI
jgi:PAS domain S-box-containing protein